MAKKKTNQQEKKVQVKKKVQKRKKNKTCERGNHQLGGARKQDRINRR